MTGQSLLLHGHGSAAQGPGDRGGRRGGASELRAQASRARGVHHRVDGQGPRRGVLVTKEHESRARGDDLPDDDGGGGRRGAPEPRRGPDGERGPRADAGDPRAAAERADARGLLARHDRRRVSELHQNAQRLLRPLLVVNPFARDLPFPDTTVRTRRDHPKYRASIRAIALLHPVPAADPPDRGGRPDRPVHEVTPGTSR